MGYLEVYQEIDYINIAAARNTTGKEVITSALATTLQVNSKFIVIVNITVANVASLGKNPERKLSSITRSGLENATLVYWVQLTNQIDKQIINSKIRSTVSDGTLRQNIISISKTKKLDWSKCVLNKIPTVTLLFVPSTSPSVSPSLYPSSVYSLPTLHPSKLSTSTPPLIPSAQPLWQSTISPSFQQSNQPSPSMPPTPHIPSLSTSASGSAAAIGGGIAGAIVGLLCIFLILYLIRLKSLKVKLVDDIGFHDKSGEFDYRDSFQIDEERHLDMNNPSQINKKSGVPTRLSGSPLSTNSGHVTKQNTDYSISTKNSAGSLSSTNSNVRDFVPIIDWASLKVISNDKNECIIGKGSFGVVIKGTYVQPSTAVSNNTENVTVAIKVITKTLQFNARKDTMQNAFKNAIQEVKIVIVAERKIFHKDCIIKVYGVATGALPKDVCAMMSLGDDTEAIGIVMRYEGGGSLQSLIHRREPGIYIAMIEKLRILKSIARGLAELHSADIVHADIKPDNVLLSDSIPPEIRLADFGLSVLRDHAGLDLSTLAGTAHTRGTPIYCAPELLHNPYFDYSTMQSAELVAKPSRKTDVYALGVVAWELLTEQKPFQHARNEIMLSSIIHQGQRPPIIEIPSDCPQAVVRMIESCWSTDRSQRKSAVQCHSILNCHYSILIKGVYDVYICYESSANIKIPCEIFHRLTQMGLKVFCKDDGLSDSNFDLMTCKTYVPIVSQRFALDSKCMQDLRDMKKINPPRAIVPVFIESDRDTWCSQELSYLLQLRSAALWMYDITAVATDESWLTQDGPSDDVLNNLYETIDNLSKYLKASIENV